MNVHSAPTALSAERTCSPGAPTHPPPHLGLEIVARDDIRLLVIDRNNDPRIVGFAQIVDELLPGDLVVVNDAATLPGSLRGITSRGDAFELRLSAPIDGNRLHGALFGPGDHRTRTEDRPAPPAFDEGATVHVAGFAATVVARAGRRVELVAHAPTDELWRAVYRAGVPVQYAHREEPLALWSVQTAYAARPWAAEMPSAGRPLTWEVLLAMRRRGVAIARLTHAAGLSSTGDPALDRALPWPERFEIPRATAIAIAEARARSGRVIAIGTTVVRALEAAADAGTVRAGSGVATLRIGADYHPRIVDGVLSGLHAPGESHFELLSAFVPAEQLARGLALAARRGLSGHELGDACWIASAPRSAP